MVVASQCGNALQQLSNEPLRLSGLMAPVRPSRFPVNPAANTEDSVKGSKASNDTSQKSDLQSSTRRSGDFFRAQQYDKIISVNWADSYVNPEQKSVNFCKLPNRQPRLGFMVSRSTPTSQPITQAL